MKKKYYFSELIEEVSERNSDLKFGLDNIVGVTIEKGLIPTIANLTQTALDKFYLVKPETFVYNPRTHGVRLGMGYNNSENTYITSWNNVAFIVKQEAKDILNPEFLWLYFNRSEWDRETNYYAWGSSTIVFSWNNFLSLSIELPNIDEQNKVVDYYKIVQNRIELKQKINDNLLATAQAIYKSWFVDYAPFNSSCPENWSNGCVEDIADFFDSVRKPLSSLERADMERIYPYYGAVSIVDFVDDYLFDGEYLLVSEDGIYVVDENGHPLLQHITGKFWANNHAHILKGKSGFTEDSLYLFLSNTNMAPIVTGAAQPKINQANLKSFPIVIPDEKTLASFNQMIAPLFDKRLSNESEIKHLEELKDLMLTKLTH
ncbi:restriction endonuclease subunit S [Frisingicoccus sp.]